jgi:error-prone DNA polymerase
VDGPREDIDVLLSGSCKHQKEPSTMTIAMIGLDTAKTVFQVHGIDKSGRAVLRRKLHRSELVRFFEQQPQCTVFLEACGAGHYWGRLLRGFGYEVKLIAPRR